MQFSFAQDKTVSGVVSDNVGPIPGANVVVKGTTRSTQTDMDGKYSVKAKQGETLVFSFLGLATQEVKVGASNTISVKLAAGATELKEVFVGAMGIKRTKDAVVSSQKQIGAAELTQANNPNAVQSLAGKVSGLQVSTVSNGVSPTVRIVLRGNRTITGDNQALVIIDNAISSASVLQQLPPDVIENVNIIKGAQGAALYGAQGVNGVIIVTTKKGTKKEKFTFGFNSAIDFESISFIPERQMEYGQGWATDPGFAGPSIPANSGFVPWENGSWGPAFVGGGMPAMVPVGMPQADGSFFMTEYAPIKDNIKQFFKTGSLTQNGFNFNVGGSDSYAFLSVNRQTTDFVVQDDQLQRTSFLFKAGKQFGKFRVDGNVNYINQNTSQTDSDLFEDLIQTATNVPVSRFKNSGNEGHWTVYAQNPYWITDAVRFDNRSDVFNGIATLSYDFNKHISVSYNANIQISSSDAQSHRDAFTNISAPFSIAPYNYYGATTESYEALGGSASGSSYFANQASSTNIYTDLLVNFDYDLTKDLNLKVNVGNNIQDRMFRITSQGGSNLDVPGFYHISNILNPSNPATLDNRLTRSRRIAGFVNADLNYKDYLFLNATARGEEYSAVKNAYFYPSVGVSFIPTKAFENIKSDKFNYAKINASYTSVGNTSAVGPYATNNLAVIPSGFPYGDLASYAYNQVPTNPNIKPEFVNTLEIGAQLGFFNDRVTVEGSFYMAKTKDLITRATSSSASGNASYLTNIGELENKGFEIDLGFVPVKTQDFKWDLRTNYTTYKTKVLKLAEGATSVNLLTNGEVGIFAEVGEQFPLIKGTAFVRDAQGNIIVNANGTPQKTSTLEKLGKGVPDYIVGLTNSFDYKGLKLTVVADYRTGASTYSEMRRLMLFTGGDMDTAGFDRNLGIVVPNSVILNPVTGTYVANTTPALGASSAGVLNYFTTTFRTTGEANMVDASALKIREISLSYALPKKFIEKAGLESFRIGINARNPFVFLADGSLLKAKNGYENRGYLDPEASTTAGNAQGYTNIGQYPTTRTFGASINLTF